MTPHVNNFVGGEAGGRKGERWLVGGCRLEVDGDGDGRVAVVLRVVACPRACVNRWVSGGGKGREWWLVRVRR